MKDSIGQLSFPLTPVDAVLMVVLWPSFSSKVKSGGRGQWEHGGTLTQHCHINARAQIKAYVVTGS